jgi:hypothetical protein
MIQTEIDLLLADRIWLAVAMLHREFPDRQDFSKDEIRRRLVESGLADGTKPTSVHAHLKQHLVANVPPSSTRKYRMLFETRAGYLRLFRRGDFVDFQRQPHQRPKYAPERDEIPLQYHPFLDWYETWSEEHQVAAKPSWEDDPLIRLIGSGKHIWADEHADEYVENLRREDI